MSFWSNSYLLDDQRLARACGLIIGALQHSINAVFAQHEKTRRAGDVGLVRRDGVAILTGEHHVCGPKWYRSISSAVLPVGDNGSGFAAVGAGVGSARRERAAGLKAVR